MFIYPRWWRKFHYEILLRSLHLDFSDKTYTFTPFQKKLHFEKFRALRQKVEQNLHFLNVRSYYLKSECLSESHPEMRCCGFAVCGWGSLCQMRILSVNHNRITATATVPTSLQTTIKIKTLHSLFYKSPFFITDSWIQLVFSYTK